MHPSQDPRRPGYGGGPQPGGQRLSGGQGYQPPGYRPTVPSAGRSGQPAGPPPRHEPPRYEPPGREPQRQEPRHDPRRDEPARAAGPSRAPGRRAVQIDPVLVEIVAGLVWLTVGSLGLDAAGAGTILLAAGIGVGGWILVENRRRGPQPFDPARSAELIKLAGGAVVIVILASILFGLVGWTAFLPGLAAVVTGGALVMLSTSTGQSATRWLGIAVAVLGVVSAFVSTQSATGFFSQGIVGLLVGVLLLLSSADRVGLLEMLRDRFR